MAIIRTQQTDFLIVRCLKGQNVAFRCSRETTVIFVKEQPRNQMSKTAGIRYWYFVLCLQKLHIAPILSKRSNGAVPPARIICLQLPSLSPSMWIVYEDYDLYKMQSLSKNSELLWRQIQSGPQSSRLYTPVKKPSEKSFPIPNNWEIPLYFRQWFDNRTLRKRLDWPNLHT